MDSRDFRSIFRQMFGFPNSGSHNHNREDLYQDDREEFDPRRGPPFHHDSREDDGFNFNSRGFSVYTDPFEMNRFFDQQLDEMLKMFGHSFGFGHNPGGSYGGESRMIPLVEPDDEGPSHARDFMLKDDGQQPRVDTEVDSDNVDMRELDRLMKSRDNPCRPHHQEQEPTSLWGLFSPPSFDRRELPSGGRGNFHSFGSSIDCVFNGLIYARNFILHAFYNLCFSFKFVQLSTCFLCGPTGGPGCPNMFLENL